MSLLTLEHFYRKRVFQPNELLGVARQPGAIAITSCKPTSRYLSACPVLDNCRGRDDHRGSPPAQIRTSAFTHTALTLDEQRRSAHQDRDAECGVAESTGSRVGRDAPSALARVDCDGRGCSATTDKRGDRKCAAESSCPERHGIGSSPAQPSEAMYRPRSCDHASGVEAQPLWP